MEASSYPADIAICPVRRGPVALPGEDEHHDLLQMLEPFDERQAAHEEQHTIEDPNHPQQV